MINRVNDEGAGSAEKKKSSKTKPVSYSRLNGEREPGVAALQEAEKFHQKFVTKGLSYAANAGHECNKAKNSLEAGKKWTEWFEEQRNKGVITFSLRMAQYYMSVANKGAEADQEQSLKGFITATTTPRRSVVVRKRAERFVLGIVDHVLDDFTSDEKLLLAEKQENAQLMSKAKIRIALKETVDKLREVLREELNSGKK